ncbi:rho GTPase-activating protein 92B [Stomoxys calcitrans]|uniref:rho GTPase-activating protein 92B n=1 Tax=Stomoxys calcitrans TaxID=35570 RepID=UPI0027E30215|nr:rho GTPase-activating protein 92B [Stomoxys calcitrans]
MKKQFTKIKIAAENLSRSTKPDRKDCELEIIEKQVEKYRDVLDKMVKKLPAGSADIQDRDKRIKKQSHYKIGQALEESSKELSTDMPLHHVLLNSGELEKSLAECIVDSELETEFKVVKRLKLILDKEIQEISTLKRNVSRTLQEYASLTRSYEASKRLDEPQAKINNIKDQQEQCEVKLEKERDMWAAQMFELIAKEDVIVHCIRDYVINQKNYHERALRKVDSSLANIQEIIESTVKSRFGTCLTEHLASTNREISYIIELCVCCLVENGLHEEGLLRVGCASTKLRRMKHALEAQHVKTPLTTDYQDPHVIGSILKLYLRELPEPLLTYRCYDDFIKIVECHSEQERKSAIKATLAKLPKANYDNLRYLTKFLWLVTQNVEYNKMSSHNLAIVMSPNMLWPRKDENNPDDYMGQVNSSSAVNIIVDLLINHWEFFFEGDVDFFVTLQRGKLYVEDKSKSNSSNENLDRHDGDVAESPRYGTIRRQKACAPSPPMKLQNVMVSSDPNGSSMQETSKNNGELQHNNHQRAKELFPTSNNDNNSGTMTNAPSSLNNNNNGHTERPEIPPPPKQLQLQQLQLQDSNTSNANNITGTHQQQNHQNGAPPPLSAKPVPMTRTQFFGLDNLPSPVADRKSNDSVNSMTFKPDLPQKPKIPKRPMVLGLNTLTTTNRSSDEESGGPISSHTQQTSSSTNNTNGTLRGNKTAEQLVQEHCDNVTALQANIGSSNTSIPSAIQKEANYNSQSNNEVNANPNPSPALFAPPPPMVVQKMTATSQNSNPNSLHATNTQVTPTATGATLSVHNENNKSMAEAATPRLMTPTTPVSPNMIMTPKRPTVPAPPPPVNVKKQVE